MATHKEVLIKKDYLCCSICLETYETPRSMPCLHSFCHLCLIGYVRKLSDKPGNQKVYCPMCRSNAQIDSDQFNSAEEWVENLPINFTLVSILNDSKLTMDFEDTHCEPCLREDIKTEAIIYCYDCSEKLCEECKRHHKKSKSSTNHKLLDCASKLDMKDIDYFRQLSKCPKHNSKDVKYLCKDHDQLCCNECAIVTHRKCEDMVSLADEARGNEENGSRPNIPKRLEDIMSHADLLIEHETGYKPGLDEAEEKLKSRLKKIKTNLDDAYSKLENKIMSEMSAKRKALNKASSLQEEAVENLKTEAKQLYDKMKRASEFGQQTQMFLMERETMTDVQKHEETLRTCHEQASNTVLSMTETKSMQDLSDTLSKCLYIEELSTDPSLPPCPSCLVHRDFKERTAVHVRTIDLQEEYCYPRYCLWIDNYLIISLQGQDNLKLYDAQNGTLLSTYSCSAEPCAMTAVEGSNFAVALPGACMIDIMSVSPSQLKPIRTAVQTSTQLRSIAYDKQNKQLIAVSKSANTLIKFHLDGRDAGTIRVGSNALIDAKSIVVDDKLNRIYISAQNTNKLNCVDMSGKRVFQYSHTNLKDPRSVIVDSDSNVYVVSNSSNCIQQLNKEGMFIREIVSNGNDLVGPVGMCFNNDMSKFVVTCKRKGKEIQIYKFE